MVENILGNYLVKTGKITDEQLQAVIQKEDETRVKMGLLAVSEGILTIEQADYINGLQATMDKRFGDIAVEKGFLTEDQISNLLKKQGNAYLTFAQTLVNENLLSMQELENMLDGFQEEYGFTKSDMEDLRSDEPERIVPLFLPPEALCFREIAGVMVRTLIRCVDKHIYLDKAECTDLLQIKKAVIQKMEAFSTPVEGLKELGTGFAEENGGLFTMAASFCKADDLKDEDMLDGAGEVLNCINGLYVSGLSRNGVECELLPPVLMDKETELQDVMICKIPVCLHDKKCEFIMIGRK